MPSIFSTEALRALGAVGLAHAVAAIDHRRVHRPGADAVDADVVLAVVDRHRLGEPDHRGLRDGVGREAARPQRRDRRDVDDRAALGGLDHRRDRVLGEQEHRLDVDLHDAAVFVGLLVDHAAAAADADIVVEEVEPAPVIDRGIDQPLAVGFLGGVAGLGDGGAALGLDHLDGALGQLQVEVRHHDLGAGARQQDRGGAAVADAVAVGAAARHDRHLARQAESRPHGSLMHSCHPASGSLAFLVRSPVPFDLEGVALGLDVARVGAGKVGGAEQRVALDAILEQPAPRPGRQVLVGAELARPVGMIDLDRVMHDVAREAGLLAAVLEVDGDRARRVAGIVLDGEHRVGLVVAVDHHRLAGLDDRQHRIVERAAVDLLALRLVLVLPVRVLALGEQVLGVGEGRHPAAVLELGVPADVIDVQVRAHHEVDRIRARSRRPSAGRGTAC